MNRIRELRQKRGLSQKELADILFVNQTAVSQWERGATTPNPSTLRALADMFQVTIDYLLERDTDKPSATLDEQLSDIEFALYGEVRELTDDEKRDILDYVRFKRAQKHGDSK